MKTVCLLIVLIIFNSGIAQVGPDAPEVNIMYLSGATPGFSFDLSNPTSSNNYLEAYSEFDINIDPSAPDPIWKFQGYLIFQLLNDTIDVSETFDPNYAQIAAVVDLLDTVTSINLIVDGCISTPLALANSGTQGNHVVTIDAFTGSPFIPNQEYCFRVFAFANNPFSQDATCSVPNYAALGVIT